MIRGKPTKTKKRKLQIDRWLRLVIYGFRCEVHFVFMMHFFSVCFGLVWWSNVLHVAASVVVHACLPACLPRYFSDSGYDSCRLVCIVYLISRTMPPAARATPRRTPGGECSSSFSSTMPSNTRSRAWILVVVVVLPSPPVPSRPVLSHPDRLAGWLSFYSSADDASEKQPYELHNHAAQEEE